MSTSANGAQTDPAELVPPPVSQLNSPRGSENGLVDPVQPPSSPPAAPAAALTGTATMSLLERLERVLSAPVKDVPLTEDSKLERALLQRMEESEEMKRHPYKGTLKSFKGLLDQIEKELDHQDAKTKLKEAYIRKVEGVNPPTVEEAYIVNWALYGNVKNPSLLLAYLFINTPAELRTQLANWHFFANLFGSGQQNLIGPKLETLQLPLYPDNKLQATNESILREGSMVGGEAIERRAIEKHFSTHNLIGGGPYTTVPVYTEGNDQPVAVADGRPSSPTLFRRYTPRLASWSRTSRRFAPRSVPKPPWWPPDDHQQPMLPPPGDEEDEAAAEVQDPPGSTTEEATKAKRTSLNRYRKTKDACEGRQRPKPSPPRKEKPHYLLWR
ncbi:hypothetical protein, conserved [Angomonas deanei]|uniref:Uncharacterized protein n=1 Tax=Angomonas deanei TaxID=59799 RepID=A0A7G2CJM6_9TRYP|nr:hypothetical protein, conserved [Angomonas deanei]